MAEEYPNSVLNVPRSNRRTLLLMLVLLIVAGPLFVCMPVNSDTALFDLQAEAVTQNGILYRDVIEPNLPGVVWLHLTVRAAVGWSTEAMRSVDLLIFGGMLLLFSRVAGRSPANVVFATASLLFYMSCNEWCHCQRDTWMLLPSLVVPWIPQES